MRLNISESLNTPIVPGICANIIQSERKLGKEEIVTSATSMYSGKFNSTGVRHLFHHHDRLTCRMK